MKFCKVCDCGNIMVFEGALGFPMQCPDCGRLTDGFETYPEGDPAIEIRLAQVRERLADRGSGQGQAEDPGAAPGTLSDGSGAAPSGETEADGSHAGYCLRLAGGAVIPIPDEGCIIGRTANGGEELAEYGSVSRQHVRITPMRRGVLVEDLSTYGTWVNGKKLEKNMPERTAAGAVIMLCDLETTLEYR